MASAWLLGVPVPALATETRAGSVIVNVASVRQGEVTATSNAVRTPVAERLDLTLAPDGGAPGSVAVTLVNRGNGEEAFDIAATAHGQATSGVVVIAIAGAAPVPLPNGRTPPLVPGASATLLVPVTAIGDGAALTVSARAATGSGTPGQVFAGQGDGGGDAVVGATGAAASVTIPLSPAADTAPTLTKSQAVTAPDGSATPVVGARIAYTLVARFAAAADAAAIDDPVPAGTAYVAGSLTLDGAALADVGHVAAGQISVPLGAVAAGTVRTLRFTVVIS